MKSMHDRLREVRRQLMEKSSLKAFLLSSANGERKAEMLFEGPRLLSDEISLALDRLKQTSRVKILKTYSHYKYTYLIMRITCLDWNKKKRAPLWGANILKKESNQGDLSVKAQALSLSSAHHPAEREGALKTSFQKKY